MSSYEDDLYAAHIKAGACEATAKELAAEQAYYGRKRFARDKMHLDMQDLIERTSLSNAGIASRVGCNRETVRRAKLKSAA